MFRWKETARLVMGIFPGTLPLLKALEIGETSTS